MVASMTEIEGLIARRTIDFTDIKIKMENHLIEGEASISVGDVALAVAQLCDNLIEMAQDIAEIQEAVVKARRR